MAVYFLDSSAAAKLYVVEQGTMWLTGLADPTGRNQLFIVRLTPVEIAAALFRRVKGSTLSQAQATTAMSSLRRDVEWTFQVVEYDAVLSDLALTIAERHGLRGYDCVQLAAALSLKRLRDADNLPPPGFVSADSELNEASRAEGLQVIDPNEYP